MKYRQLGKYGIRLSEIGLGSWLTYGMGVEDKTAEDCVIAAFECGINFFDTADVYNKGGAEEAYGTILFDKLKVKREDIIIATKCYFPISENPNDRGLSRKHIFESVHKSLKRLKTDYIDIQQCHRYDETTPLEETCRAFNDLIQQGKILYWGVSEWSAENIKDAIYVCDKYNLHKPVSNQPQYSIIRPQIETNGVIAVSEKYGLGQVVWSPLAQGILTGKYSGGKIPADSRAANEKMNWFLKDRIDADVTDKVDRLKAEVTNGMCVSLAQFALAWCLRTPNVTSAITSGSKASQIKENAEAVNIIITEETDNKVKEIFNNQ
ncbi:MAG: aldo/keto reductase [Ignavibacteriae bacterium]|nr:MAG: aldo/keto reductase [Ignavibacteriota bacterium]